MLNAAFWAAATFALGVGALVSPLAPTGSIKRSDSQTITVRNSQTLRFDVDGNGPLDVGNHKLTQLNGQFIIYETTYGCGYEWCLLHCIPTAHALHPDTSPDLVHWVKQGPLFSTEIYSTLCAATASSVSCGRPHVVFNAKSQKYVLYLNQGPDGYTVLTSDSPTSGFVVASTPTVAVDALVHGDFTVEVVNGKGMILYTAFDFSGGGSIWPPFHQRMYAQYLTDDYLNTTGQAFRIASAADDEVDLSQESPDIFLKDGLFYVTATVTCGTCNGTLAIVYRSASLEVGGNNEANQVTQTWLNSKTGTLREVGVNLAVTLQDVPITATIFEYQNNTNFFTSGYKWTQLYTETLKPSNFTRSLDAIIFKPVNVTVQAGARLGISLLSYGNTRVGYCRLEHTVAPFDVEKTTNGLFLNGIGQVSIRGKNGDASPVFASSGKELKWFSVVD
ncbi:hypothetical protein RQP46_003995 [Phenoliferia psychrophenolica]